MLTDKAGVWWLGSTPTIMSEDGVTKYVNCTAEHFPKDKDSQEWVERARAKGEYPSIVHRAHVESMLKGVDPKAVDAAKLDPSTTDVAAPTTGSAETKEAALRAKLASVLPVAEFDKLAALRATVEEKPVEPVEEVGEVTPKDA